MSNNNDKFHKNIRSIGDNVRVYYEHVKNSKAAFLVLHQHFGLLENIIFTCEAMTEGKISIMAPDLFANFSKEEFSFNKVECTKKLKFSEIEDIVMECIKFLSQFHQKLYFMGFSIGSAFATKILEQIGEEQIEIFDAAFLFYGLPDLKKINPSSIKTSALFFHGTQDKVKFLSDPSMYEQFFESSQGEGLMEDIIIEGAGHGFMNPDSPNFDEEYVRECCGIVQSFINSDPEGNKNLRSSRNTHRKNGTKKGDKNKEDKGQEGSGCNVF